VPEWVEEHERVPWLQGIEGLHTGDDESRVAGVGGRRRWWLQWRIGAFRVWGKAHMGLKRRSGARA